MPRSNYGRVIHQTQVEQMTAMISGVVSKPGFSATDWSAPITNYGQVLQEIAAGKTDQEISARHPGWKGDVLMVCHKIVEGGLSEPNDQPITENQAKREKKAIKEREKERMAAYRRRYGTRRDL